MIEVQVIGLSQRPHFAELLAARPAGQTWSVIVEGLWRPAGLDDADMPAKGIDVRHLGACACCMGNAALRVALARIIRHVRPQRLFMLCATDDHLASVVQTLQDEQYSTHLRVL
jgi:hypothetical protein